MSSNSLAHFTNDTCCLVTETHFIYAVVSSQEWKLLFFVTYC